MKIVVLSDSPYFPTGYSNQSKLLTMYLSKKGHEIHYLANGYTGATIANSTLSDGTHFPFKVYGQGKQQYFQDTMSHHLKEIGADKFIILLDTFMLHGADGWFLNVDTAPAETYFWYPSDGGGGMPVRCENILRKIDNPVAMAKFGQKQVKDYYNIDTLHIPHGTEAKRFYKLPEEDRAKLRASKGLSDKFVIGVVARNQGRKMLDRTIKAMSIIKDRIPNAVLYLHVDPNDPAQVWDIRNLIKRYNLENRVLFTGMNALKGFDWNEMNNVYNVMDVFFLSTSGEGFGVPIIEAMSAEVPVVATDYTTTPELVIDNKSGFGVKLAGVEETQMFDKDTKEYDRQVMNGTLTGSWEVERGLMDVKDAADKIEILYKRPDIRKEMGTHGRKAVLEKYDFDTVVGPAWEKLLNGK